MKNNSNNPKISFIIVALFLIVVILLMFATKILIYKDGCNGEVVVLPKVRYEGGMVFDRGVDRVCIK